MINIEGRIRCKLYIGATIVKCSRDIKLSIDPVTTHFCERICISTLSPTHEELNRRPHSSESELMELIHTVGYLMNLTNRIIRWTSIFRPKSHRSDPKLLMIYFIEYVEGFKFTQSVG